MKVTVEKSALLAAVQAVSPAVKGSTPLPALKCVKLHAGDGRLTLTATDQELTARFRILCDPDRAGSCLIDAAEFAGVLRAAADGPVTIDADAKRVRVSTAPKSRIDKPVFPVEEFPDHAATAGDWEPFTTTAGELRRGLRRVAFACDDSSGSGRFTLSGVLLDATESPVTLVASDTKGMAVTTLPGTLPDDLRGAFILPPKLVKVLPGLLADDAEPVRCTLRPNWCVFSTERAEVHTRLLEGRFAPWRDVMKQLKCVDPLAVPPADLLAAVRAAALATSKEMMRVDASFSPGKLVLAARGAGESEVELPLPACDRTHRHLIDVTVWTPFLSALLSDWPGCDPIDLYLFKNPVCVFKAGPDYTFMAAGLVEPEEK